MSRTNEAVVITGNMIPVFRLRVILGAIDLYLKTGMQANRAYTPTNMRRAVGEYTGKTYPRSKRGLVLAAADLRTLLEIDEPRRPA